MKKHLYATAIEEQIEGDAFYIAHTPRHTWDFTTGSQEIKAEAYADELEAATGIRPISTYMKDSMYEENGVFLVSFPAGTIKPGRKVTLFSSPLFI